MSFLTFYITCPTEENAKTLAQGLLSSRLAAGTNVFPIESFYWWKGEVAQSGEWVLLVKTSQKKEKELEDWIARQHPYEVPCIIRWEVRANASFEQWIEEETSD